MRWYNTIPTALFRAKTGNYARLRPQETPLLEGTTLCLPRLDKRWTGHPPDACGLSLLIHGKRLRNLNRIRHVFAFNEGKSIPGGLILYQTAVDHYSLEPEVPMELEGIFLSVHFRSSSRN